MSDVNQTPMGCFSIALSKVGTNRDEGDNIVRGKKTRGRRQRQQIESPNPHNVGREEGTQ